MTSYKAIVNFDICTGCALCENVCQKGAISIQEMNVGCFPIYDRETVLKNRISALFEDLRDVKNLIEKEKGR